MKEKEKTTPISQEVKVGKQTFKVNPLVSDAGAQFTPIYVAKLKARLKSFKIQKK